MEYIQILEKVCERDIDLLVIEELHISEAFSQWFCTQTIGFEDAQFIGAYHSVHEAALGESDIAILFKNRKGHRLAVLVENKIDAPIMPRQAERYQDRGKVGIKCGKWEGFQSCIMAPQRYIASLPASERYDLRLPYETLRSYFDGVNDKRAKYRAHLIGEGIAQNRRGYVPVLDEGNTKFWQDYYEYSCRNFSDLGMKKQGEKGKKSYWLYFHPTEKPNGTRLIHKMKEGLVGFEFTGKASEIGLLQEKYKGKLHDDMSWKTTSKSATLHVKVRPVDNNNLSLESQQEQVREAHEAARRLIRIIAANGIQLL